MIDQAQLAEAEAQAEMWLREVLNAHEMAWSPPIEEPIILEAENGETDNG